MKDLHSDDNEEETEGEENDNDSEMEKAVNSQGGARSHRVSLSDGSDIESNSTSSPLHHDLPPPLLKANNNQILEVKSPVKPNKSDKSTKNGDCDKIVNLIEETGHFHITNTTFDFDLCSLDKSTVRKLQSYLESSGTS
uniref:MLLT3 super elongation complex subunit n=1 Tax=Ornithorhynchus anatinus TaxID=9258 RepID=F7EYN1_ORNAN